MTGHADRAHGLGTRLDKLRQQLQNPPGMRVLYVTSRFPCRGVHGDQVRAFQQLLQLGQRHAIRLVSAAPPDPRHSGLDELRACCESIDLLPLPAWRQLLGMARAGILGRPLQTGLYDLWPGKRLSGILEGGDFDLVHVQLARLAGVLPRVAPLPCVVDLVDALSLNMRRRAEFGRPPMAWIARSESRRLQRLEESLISQATALCVSAQTDLQALPAAAKVTQVGNGFEPSRFPFCRMEARSEHLVFVGNLGYFPNVDAALWLVDEVLPRLRARWPQTRLQLVGARPALRLRRHVAGHPQVELVGPVEDVHPYLARAGIALAPLRAGSGQQLKLLEAMASGAPVVASTGCAAAVEAEHGRHLLVADSAEATANAIDALLRDRQAATAFATAARALVEQRWSWQRSAESLEALWLQAATRAL